MAYEELKKSLKDWEYYEKNKSILPSYLVEHEQKSIAKEVALRVKQMKEKNEYEQVSAEEQKLINKIIDLIN